VCQLSELADGPSGEEAVKPRRLEERNTEGRDMKDHETPDSDGVIPGQASPGERLNQSDNFAELMEQVRQGSQEAAAQVWRQYGSYVIYVVRRSLHQSLRAHVDSQDFAQDVWASFFRALPPADNLQTPEALFRFLTRMARNKVIDEHRRLNRQVRDVKRDVSHGVFLGDNARIDEREPTPSQLVAAEDLLDGIAATESPDRSRIVRLRREGLSDVEIAARVRVTTRSVRRVIQHVKRLFRQKWGLPIE
jgi:RNA polymerase sigma factor (sigma-70 family)